MYHPSTAEKQTASSYTQQTHSSGKLGQRESQESITAQSTSLTSDVSTMASVPSAVDTSSEGVVLTTQASGLTPSIDSDEPELRRLESLEKEFKESQKESSNQSISSMLASVSERVMERCGYKFEEDRGMCYQGLTGLFYDQVCSCSVLKSLSVCSHNLSALQAEEYTTHTFWYRKGDSILILMVVATMTTTLTPSATSFNLESVQLTPGCS